MSQHETQPGKVRWYENETDDCDPPHVFNVAHVTTAIHNCGLMCSMWVSSFLGITGTAFLQKTSASATLTGRFD